MNSEEVVSTLQEKAKIEPLITKIGNKVFFLLLFIFERFPSIFCHFSFDVFYRM